VDNVDNSVDNSVFSHFCHPKMWITYGDNFSFLVIFYFLVEKFVQNANFILGGQVFFKLHV